MATKSSSRLKSVPEKLKNYLTEQDEEYFSSQENDDVFRKNEEEIMESKIGEFVWSIV